MTRPKSLSRKQFKILSIVFIVAAVLFAVAFIYQPKNSSIPGLPVDAPDTTKPSAEAVDNHSVHPATPRYLRIDKYGIKSRIIPLGLNKDNQLESPNNIHDSGWYRSSALPGQPGAMLIDGHVSSWESHGVFYDLKNMKIGDKIQIERGDGTIFNYEVVKMQKYDAQNVDMTAAQQAIDPLVPGLNLITCAGKVIKGTNDFTHRLIVFTKQV